MTGCVYVVHCVDTEGPLYESLDATFERLNNLLGLSLEPGLDLLHKIQSGTADIGSKSETAQLIASPDLLAYMQDWGQLDAMLDELLSSKFRRQYCDPENNSWVYNWFIMDHVGYDINPRRKDVGYHNIYDHYVRRLHETHSNCDEIHWHFHPSAFAREGHICATSFLNSPHLLEGVARRIIDRGWFPRAYRAGFNSERPDSHWFLEQWIPIDFSNQSLPKNNRDQDQADLASGRFGDWRRAPSDWLPYHPAHDDYQVPGRCNRAIFRCLNVGTRARLLTQEEVERAFERASRGEDQVLAFCDHDWRDMRKDVANVHSMVNLASKRYPNARWRCSPASAAARACLGWGETASPLKMELNLARSKAATKLIVTANIDLFGPQPFLAIKTWSKQYLNDNFDVDIPGREWSYVFDESTIDPRAIESIGVASNARNASGSLVVCDVDGKVQNRKSWD